MIDILVPDGSHLNDWRDVAMIVGRLRSVPGLTADVSQWNVLNQYAQQHESATSFSVGLCG